MSDCLADNKLQLNLLLFAYDNGFVGKLKNSNAAFDKELFLQRLVQDLINDHGITEQSATWTIETWDLLLNSKTQNKQAKPVSAKKVVPAKAMVPEKPVKSGEKGVKGAKVAVKRPVPPPYVSKSGKPPVPFVMRVDPKPRQSRQSANQTAYTAEEIQEMRAILQEELKRLQTRLEKAQEDLEFQRNPGEEPADVGTDNNRRETRLRMMQRDAGQIKMLQDSLSRLNNGHFGICQDCGKLIGMARLRAKPHARYCIDCKEKHEARGEHNPDHI